MKEVRVPLGDHELFCVVGGSGPGFMFIHGGLGTHQQTLPHLEPLSDEFTVISIDARGRGRSVCTDPSLQAWPRLADDVVAVLDHLGIERAGVGGASFGAALTVAVGLRHPGRCGALVLVAPATAGNDIGWVGLQGEMMARTFAMADVIEASGTDEAVETLTAGLPPKLTAHLTGRLSPHDPASLVALLRGLERAGQPFDALEELGRLKVPTLLIPGGDPAHPREVSELYMKHLPDVSVAELEIKGELGEADRADSVRDVMVPVLREFLRQHLSTPVS